MTIRCVVPVSGGKDSQVCLELALRHFPRESVIGLFNDTQFDHPMTYGHILWMERYYGVRIERTNAGSVPEKVLQYERFPNGVARFCTDDLKIKPSSKFYRDLATQQGRGFEVWLGMRSGESSARAKRYADISDDALYAPHEILPNKYPKYLSKLGVMFALPVLDWSTLDILEFLDGRENPLYRAGFDRVGCFPCLAGGDKTKRRAFEFDDFGQQQFKIVENLSQQIKKSVWTSKSEGVCSMCTI